MCRREKFKKFIYDFFFSPSGVGKWSYFALTTSETNHEHFESSNLSNVYFMFTSLTINSKKIKVIGYFVFKKIF